MSGRPKKELEGLGLPTCLNTWRLKARLGLARQTMKRKKALVELEAAYQTYQRERLSAKADPERVKELFAAFKTKQKDAAQYVMKNAFGDIVEREGEVASRIKNTGLDKLCNKRLELLWSLH